MSELVFFDSSKNKAALTGCFRHPALAANEIPGKGRGVISTEFIAANTVLEEAPVIALSGDAVVNLKPTLLYHYIFDWTTEGSTDCLVLGITSLVNHSATPNAKFERDYAYNIMKLITIAMINPDEEITINYNCDLWFETK